MYLLIPGQTIKETKTRYSREDPESTSGEEEEFVSRKVERKKRKRLAKNKEKQQLLKMRKASNDIWNHKEENDKCITSFSSWSL